MRARVVLVLAVGCVLTACGSSSTGSTASSGGSASNNGTGSPDQAAQTDLRTALAAAKSSYQLNGNFGQAGPPELRQFAPSLTFVAPNIVVTAGASQVGVSTGGDNAYRTVTLAAVSPSGTCWYLVDVASADSETLHGGSGIQAPGVWYGHVANGAPSCSAPDSGPPPASSWSAGWSSSGV